MLRPASACGVCGPWRESLPHKLRAAATPVGVVVLCMHLQHELRQAAPVEEPLEEAQAWQSQLTEAGSQGNTTAG